jgi:hypothetical protein
VGLRKAPEALAFSLEFSLLLSLFQDKERRTNTSKKTKNEKDNISIHFIHYQQCFRSNRYNLER